MRFPPGEDLEVCLTVMLLRISFRSRILKHARFHGVTDADQFLADFLDGFARGMTP